MTKSEFLDKLRAALGNDLSGAIIQENVNYYSSYISEEVSKGKTEAEVIEELGDPWVLAQTVIDSVEGKNSADVGYEENNGYSSRQTTYTGQQENTGQIYRNGGAWWKRLLFILGIIGVIMVVAGVISGLISLLLPVIIPITVIMIVVRMFRRR